MVCREQPSDRQGLARDARPRRRAALPGPDRRRRASARSPSAAGLTVEYDIFEYQEGGLNALRRTSSAAGSSTRTSCSSAASPTRTRCSSGSSSSDRRPSARTSRSTCSATTASRCAPGRSRSAFPVKWSGPSFNAKSTNVATETLEIAHQGLMPPTDRCRCRHSAASSRQASRSRAGRRHRLLVQPQGVHDREESTSGRSSRSSASALPTAQFGGGQPRKLEPRAASSTRPTARPRRPRRHREALQADGGAAALGSGTEEQRPAADGHVRLGQHRRRSRRSPTTSASSTRSSGPTARPIRAQAKLSLIQAEKAMDKSSRAARKKAAEPDDARRTRASARTRSGTATASPRSPSHTTATRRAGARSPRRTASTTRSRLQRGAVLSSPRGGRVISGRRGQGRTARRSTTRSAEQLIEVRIEDHLQLPDACLLRFTDPGLEHDRHVPAQDREPDRGALCLARRRPR